MAPSCKKVVCPMGEQPTLLEGHCCPTCTQAACIHEVVKLLLYIKKNV